MRSGTSSRKVELPVLVKVQIRTCSHQEMVKSEIITILICLEEPVVQLLFGFGMLCVFWLAGEALSYGLSLPIPGSVVGMVLMLCLFIVLKKIPDCVSEAADGLLRYLALLFVPAGVGIMAYADILLANWQPLLIALLAMMLLTLLLTAGGMTLFTRVIRWKRKDVEGIQNAAG